jgi:hypothetical protein
MVFFQKPSNLTGFKFGSIITTIDTFSNRKVLFDLSQIRRRRQVDRPALDAKLTRLAENKTVRKFSTERERTEGREREEEREGKKGGGERELKREEEGETSEKNRDIDS